jgi:precorrin-2 methylase
VPPAPLLFLGRALDGEPSFYQTSMHLIDVVDLDVDLNAITGWAVRTLLEPEVEATLAPDTHVLALLQQYLQADDVD